MARILSTPFDNFPGVEVFPIEPAPHGHSTLHPQPAGLRVVISREPPPAPTPEIEREWDKLVAQNPRLYNGPQLSVITVDFDRAEFLCRRDTFQRLCVQPRIRTGARLLAVCGVLTARDSAGREHVLLGRRGERTRVYPGMWETVPAGGVSPPAITIDTLDEAHLRQNLLEEMQEELGTTFEVGRPVALVRDHVAFSEDITFLIDAGSMPQAAAKLGAANWEYPDTRWVALDEITEFDRANSGQIITPSRALFRVLGWI